MNNTKSAYLPFTQDDILTLRGEPMATRSESLRVPIVEWIYYNINTNTKERYLFKNERLISYKKDATV